jgi:hypothetical protein
LLRLSGTIGAALFAVLSLGSLAPVALAQFETRSASITGQTPLSVVAADFNHDGKMDLATASVTRTLEVQVFLGNGDGTFGPPTRYDVGAGSGPLATADLTHDGNVDLVVVNGGNDTLSVLLGNGDGTFQAPMNFATPPDPIALVLGDFNGDGKIDIATADVLDNQGSCVCVSVLLGNGDGTFQEPPIITPLTVTPYSMAAGYFNADKNLDLAVPQDFGSSSDVQILLGNGDGTFTVGTSYPVGPSPQAIVAADFNKDHKTDLAVAEAEGMGVAVFLGNGDGTFQGAVEYRVYFASDLAVADLNADGNLDIAVASDVNPLKAGAAAVLLGNGDGTFQNATYYSVGVFPSAIAIADFNGDRQPDLAVAAQDSSRVYVLLNTGAVSLSPTTPIEFHGQKAGTKSKPQVVTLTNTGKTALTISSMKIKGEFGMTSTCGTSVAAGANCAISIDFSPKSQGPLLGSLSIRDSASTKPQVIELSGTGK